jgi:hypothetical protein
MLKCKGPAFVEMTAQTSLFVRGRLIYHGRAAAHAPGGSARSMRIMAVAAFHKSLIDAVLKRHGEFRFLRNMAAITKLRLAFG